MKVRDVMKRLNDEGWLIKRTKGDHRQYVHPRLPGRVTVPGHPGDDLHPDTLRSIYRQADWGRP